MLIATGPSLRDLNSFLPLSPAPKRWAKLIRPCRGWILRRFDPPGYPKRVLTHTLKAPAHGQKPAAKS
jgi:hypothetical protein